ncbi:glycine receptor subunit alpha-3-like protein [Leptotrombidium deliense]|uniref:Glycine receptor subunit alpha-3-like protein n=1 Tax=Leptotrombidium deliense TaxID=299467 RepID=A0A443SIU4_9ACAR|nr:glycine receptor subunit alpha-3-like protein [Leptotrombidium deliense]
MLSDYYSWLEVDFVFQRKLSHFIVAATIPTVIIVIVAYSSFWIGVETGPARFILTVTTFLTLTTQFAGLKSNLPPVSYITGLDIWMLGCMFFVFSAIIELAVVNYLDKKRKLKIEKRKQESEDRRRLMKVMRHEESKNLTSFPTLMCIDHALHTKIQHKEVKFSDNHTHNEIPSPFHLELNEIIRVTEPDKGIKVDCLMRVLYPLLFIIFNIVYWPLLLTQNLL